MYRSFRHNPDEGSAALTVALTVGGLAAIGGIGYLIYRSANAPKTAAPPPYPVLGGGPPPPAPAPTPGVAPTPAPAPPQTSTPPPLPATTPPITPTRLQVARTTPAAQFLVVAHREEALTPEQLANYVAAIKVIAMYERGSDAASHNAPMLTGEFRHDIGVFQSTSWGRHAVRDGDRAGRLDVITQDGIRRELGNVQTDIAANQENLPWSAGTAPHAQA